MRFPVQCYLGSLFSSELLGKSSLFRRRHDLQSASKELAAFRIFQAILLHIVISARRNMRTELRSSSAGGWIRSTSSPPTNQTARSRLSVASWERKEAFASVHKTNYASSSRTQTCLFPSWWFCFPPRSPAWDEPLMCSKARLEAEETICCCRQHLDALSPGCPLCLACWLPPCLHTICCGEQRSGSTWSRRPHTVQPSICGTTSQVKFDCFPLRFILAVTPSLLQD